jgi:hypothetical protein
MMTLFGLQRQKIRCPQAREATRELDAMTCPGSKENLEIEASCNRQSQGRFDVDGMLGRLAKWLRILGLDAQFPVKAPRPGRIFLTAKKRSWGLGIIFIESDNLMEQVRQALLEADVRPNPEHFLSRCLVCNARVRAISPRDAEGRVPAGILDRDYLLNECPQCGRVYWEGSHRNRIEQRLRAAGLDPALPREDG